MKPFLIAFILLISPLLGFSQEVGSSWSKLFEDDKVLFEYHDQDCSDKPNAIDHVYRILRVTNKTNKLVNLQWFLEMHYNDYCVNCNSKPEYTIDLSLKPNETITGNCNKDSRLKAFVRDRDGWIKNNLSNLLITNLTYPNQK